MRRDSETLCPLRADYLREQELGALQWAQGTELTKGTSMYVLRVEHAVSDFDRWKAAFDSDPVGRKESGVLRYRILRSVDEPNYVLIDLEFNTREEATKMHEALQGLWQRVDVMKDPSARVVEIVESLDY